MYYANTLDKNSGNPSAEENFHKVARAYEVLSDPQKRQVYDLEGVDGLEREEKGGNQQASPFDAFFGGHGGKPRGQDALLQIAVTLEELYNGGKRDVTFTKDVICRKCRGTGAKDGKVRMNAVSSYFECCEKQEPSGLIAIDGVHML